MKSERCFLTILDRMNINYDVIEYKHEIVNLCLGLYVFDSKINKNCILFSNNNNFYINYLMNNKHLSIIENIPKAFFVDKNRVNPFMSFIDKDVIILMDSNIVNKYITVGLPGQEKIFISLYCDTLLSLFWAHEIIHGIIN